MPVRRSALLLLIASLGPTVSACFESHRPGEAASCPAGTWSPEHGFDVAGELPPAEGEIVRLGSQAAVVHTDAGEEVRFDWSGTSLREAFTEGTRVTIERRRERPSGTVQLDILSDGVTQAIALVTRRVEEYTYPGGPTMRLGAEICCGHCLDTATAMMCGLYEVVASDGSSEAGLAPGEHSILDGWSFTSLGGSSVASEDWCTENVRRRGRIDVDLLGPVD